jgi:hypothetical protein
LWYQIEKQGLCKSINDRFLAKSVVKCTVCPRIEFTRGKHLLFLILRKNFRGITLLASFETAISVIKKPSSTQRKT